MAKVETQKPDGSIETTGKVGLEKDQDTVEEKKPKLSLMDKMFEMMIGVLSLKVQSVRLHQAITINGETKAAIDVEIHKCKMMLTPFGVMLVSKKYHDKGECKRLLTFNNCYEVEFVS